MEGDPHRELRRSLLGAVTEIDGEGFRTDLERIADDELDRHAKLAPAACTPHVYRACLSSITTGHLIRLFFGAPPGSADYRLVLDGYRRLGPNGLSWTIGPVQAEAFHSLRETLRAQVSNAPASLSLLG
jgi:hypothetical protein